MVVQVIVKFELDSAYGYGQTAYLIIIPSLEKL
jgi:hypothetical protein